MKPTQEKLQEGYDKTMAIYEALRAEKLAYDAHAAGHTDANCEALTAARICVVEMIKCEPIAQAIMLFGFRCGQEHAMESHGEHVARPGAN